MFEQLVSCTVAALGKKVKDNNKIHLSSGERLEKCVVVERIHKNVFEGAYGTKYTPDEVANRHIIVLPSDPGQNRGNDEFRYGSCIQFRRHLYRGTVGRTNVATR